MGAPITMAEEKINGFDKWEVESGARTLIEAKELRKRPKFYKTVLEEVEKQQKAAEAVLLEAKVKSRLKQTFGNPHKKKK